MEWQSLIWMFIILQKSLEIIKPRLFKGSVLVFDELNCKTFKNVALLESIGLNNLKLNFFMVKLLDLGL